MSCPNCQIPMRVNGSMWQCDRCGYLAPAGVIPAGTVLLPLAAK